jgi:murein DD-endopeptidase MepM/ murein hydrolase activator NlpD
MTTERRSVRGEATTSPVGEQVLERRRLRRRAAGAFLPTAAMLVAGGLLVCPGNTSGAQSAPRGGIGRLGSKVKQELKAAESVAARFARYMRNAAKMRTFHDSVALESGALLNILRRRGPGGGKEKPGARPPGGKPGETRVPLSPYAGGFTWPLEAGIVSSEFGQRWGKLHAGIDIAADTGEPVYASAPGVVIYAGNGISGYGNLVILRHDSSLTTVYAHNSRLEVREGDSVTRGALISKVGSTGHSTGPHLHFEIREGDRPINPRERLPGNKYIGK